MLRTRRTGRITVYLFMEKNRIDGRKMGEYDKNKENRKNY
jgi:hypothetical protein